MFKFYSIPSIDIIEKLIGEHATIKLSSAFNLNDPYELKFNLHIDPSSEEHEEYFFKSNPNGTKEDFMSWKEQIAQNKNYSWYIEQEQRNAIAQAISLCSFTEQNDNNLMWSHYTNNHKGICVEYKQELFEYLKKQENFLAFGNVKYSDEPPILNHLKDSKLNIEKTMFNKQSEWRYEKETRLIFISNKDTEYLPINKEVIKAVFIGSRVENEIEKEILSICDGTDIDIYYGITVGKSYKVQFEKKKKGTSFSRAFW